MKIVRSVSEMISLARTFRAGGRTIGLVPTMGALHDGHLSLLECAQENSDVSVLSVFVNPSQFAPNEDYEKYPRPFEKDCRKAEGAGCDILFSPTVEEMYPPEYMTTVSVSGITEKLCGKSRPNHFVGVATVVLKLLNIVYPHVAVFGQKDAQQAIVIRRMVADLHHPTRIIVAPIVREKDGLAVSSRNSYLTPEERTAAPLIREGLCVVEKLFDEGERSADILISALRERCCLSDLLRLEYAEIVDARSLEPLASVSVPALAAVACRMIKSNTRLIDNAELDPCGVHEI